MDLGHDLVNHGITVPVSVSFQNKKICKKAFMQPPHTVICIQQESSKKLLAKIRIFIHIMKTGGRSHFTVEKLTDTVSDRY